MGRQGFTKARGTKRPNRAKVPKNSKRIAKGGGKEENVLPPENDSEDWSEGNSDMASENEVPTKEEEIVSYREPSMYDNLLKKFCSKSETVAYAFERRKKEEEGRSDTEDDSDVDDDDSEFELEDEKEGSVDDSPKKEVKNGLEGSTLVGSTEGSEGSESDDEEIGDSDMDEENNIRTIAGSTSEASTSTSTFRSHLEYKLSKAEVEKLKTKKWNYDWEVPAFDAPNCKWRGTGKCFLKDIDPNSGYGLKPRLYKHLLDIYKGSGVSDFHSSKQRHFFSICNSYCDILHHNKKPFYLRGLQEDSNIMDAYVTHALNHILKTRDLVTKNNAKLANSENADILARDDFLDQGFTRPKVLILLPLASIAFRVVKRLIQLTPPKHKVKVEYMDRFSEEFGGGGEEDEDYEENVETSKAKKSSKPSDFKALFGGNNNDHFMMGIKYMGSKIRLYADFYSSDIVVASPLGLITKIGEAEVLKEKDVDYLSSIEVLIIDHADVILMQNWSHVNTVVDQFNRLPSKQHGTDIMRIRPWYLDGQAQYYRQTIILSSHLNPDINSTFNQRCLNYKGKVKLVCSNKGVLPKVLLQVQQMYKRFDAPTIADADDVRFKYFCEKVFPKIRDSIQGGILLFTSSYFEFVRLRNFLKSQEASFCLLGEYTKQADISRARVWFFQGQRKIMLYTERAHFYHRYKIRAVQNLIIYSLPERKEFYPEIVNMLEGSHNMSCTVLFSQFDQLRLERIVGSASTKRMISSEKDLFVFC